MSTGSWFLRSEVIHGFGRGGTQLGFPTANMALSEEVENEMVKLKDSVFFGWGCIESTGEKDELKDLGPYPVAMSVGMNPHFKGSKVTVEPHFIHQFPSDFYGRTVRLVILGRIRDSIAFTTLENLIDTIKNDIKITLTNIEKAEFASWKDHVLMNPRHSVDFPSPHYSTL